jgi:hypothetical protein
MSSLRLDAADVDISSRTESDGDSTEPAEALLAGTTPA